jgi:hypothetical protein
MIDLAHDLVADPPPPKAGPGARFGGSLTRNGAFSPEGKMNEYFRQRRKSQKIAERPAFAGLSVTF